MGLELIEQLGWRVPDVIVYPTGGGVGLIGIHKALDELLTLGWLTGAPPRLVAVQSTGCAPIVRAYERGAETAEPWPDARTVAFGINVASALGDFLILRAIRESGGTALSVSDESMVDGMLAIGRHAGVSAAPEGGAALIAIERLVADGSIKPHESVVLFNTGGALKYLDVLG